MSKLRARQRAKPTKPAEIGWQEFLRVNPHLAKRIECAMPGQMLYSVAMWMLMSKTSTDAHREFAKTVLPDLQPATVEPFLSIPDHRAAQCLRAMAQACDYAWEGEALHKSMPEVLIACLEWVGLIEKGGYLVSQPGSSFDRARAVMLADVDAAGRGAEYADDYKKAKEAATAIVADMQLRFEEVGLFVGALDYLLQPEARAAA